MSGTSTPQGNTALFAGLKPGCKVWLEKDGVVFGDGLFELLSLIHKYGSIAQAAKLMDMSYRAAWGKIKSFEKQWGISLVLSQTGGESGGGTVLTPAAVELVECYRCFYADLKLAMEKTFQHWFGE